MFTPTTNLRLLSTPLESDYRNTLWFPNREAQTNYFLGKTVKTFTNFNYIKKNNTIVVEGEVDLFYNCNYIMYQNANFTNKWFYAFIDRIEWASNNSVRLFVSTDCIQTWFFDITYFQSYVDRCHSDTDVAGDNIVPEDFSIGNQMGYYQVGSIDMTPNGIYVFATADPTGTPNNGTMESGIFSGAGKMIGLNTSQIDTLKSHLNTYVTNGTATAVSRIQQVPLNPPKSVSYAKHPTHLDCIGKNGITSYTPKNNKLLSGALTTAYVQMYGQELAFNPEGINGSDIKLKIGVDVTTGTVGVIVDNYGNTNITALTLTSVIPESTWAYNQYKNDYNLHAGSNAIYNRRAGVQRATARNTAALKTAIAGIEAAGTTANQFSTYNLARIALGGVGGALGGALNSAAKIAESGMSAYEAYQNQKIWDYGVDEISQDLTAITESMTAPDVGGVASSNIYIATDETALSYGFKVPPLDMIKRFDKYLTVYGYKQSEYRAINIHARSSWTFIRTMGLNAEGNFPDEDMNIIKRAFNSGIFFWAYTATYGNFDQNNAIV
jgi:hypothetical protein